MRWPWTDERKLMRCDLCKRADMDTWKHGRAISWGYCKKLKKEIIMVGLMRCRHFKEKKK